MRYAEDFRYAIGDRVRFSGVGDIAIPEHALGEVVSLVREGQYPYRVKFEGEPASMTYGYLMTEEELEPA